MVIGSFEIYNAIITGWFIVFAKLRFKNGQIVANLEREREREL